MSKQVSVVVRGPLAGLADRFWEVLTAAGDAVRLLRRPARHVGTNARRGVLAASLVRVFGPAVAKTTVPRVLLIFMGSSGRAAFSHAALTAGSPCMPNWTMNPGTWRKKRTSLKYPDVTSSWRRSAPRGDKAR